MTATPRPDPLVGTDLGPYHVERVIGHGGMGVVYLATHEGLQRRVALKLLAPDYADDEAFRARFLRESRMAASIDHPNIIPIYDAGEIGGIYFLAMRYVEGSDLETLVRAGLLTPGTTLALLAQLAGALDAAHAAGLVHRDVKPANVLLAGGGGRGDAFHAYLTDFGLTKHRGSETGLTQGGAFLGTLDYIAPEQVEGKPVDGRADQYGLACVAFECLSGRVPFVRDTDIAIAMAHLRDVPPSAVELRPELPPEVDSVLARGMAKRPDDRYSTCEAFVAALRGALGVQPTEQRRSIAAAGRRARRVAFGVIAALLVAAGAISFDVGGVGRRTGPSPSARPASPGVPASPALSGPTMEPIGEPTEAFPSSAEQALLDLVATIPDGFAATCVRGPYKAVGMRDYIRTATPVASLRCTPGAATGASEVLVRQFRPETVRWHFVEDFMADLAIAKGPHTPIVVIPAGDCALAAPAIGPWSMAGEARGTVACYTDEETGDALLYWTYDRDAILVRARNARGESEALYRFFDHSARFINP